MQITFILPIRNEVNTITSTIEAILCQTIINDFEYEILISDGGSTDGTLDIINNLVYTYPNILLIHNPGIIVSVGFNMALSQAQGDFIIRIDGHCEIPPNYLNNCITILRNKEIIIAGGKIETISNGAIGKAIAIAQSSLFGVGNVTFRNPNYNIPNYVDTLAFGVHKRKIFSEIGGYDEEMVCNQDDEFNHRVIQSGAKIWMDPTIKTKYYSRSSYMKLFKQYFNYGCFKVRGIQKRQQILSIRHFIPSIFVVVLIGTLIGYYFLNQSWLLLVIISYLTINMFSSTIVSSKINLIPMIIISYWVLHLSYGFGFIWGLLRFATKWSDNKLKDDHFNKEKFIANSVVTT